MEVFKTSLAFDAETGEKLGTQADKFRIENDCLKTEVEQLKTLLAAMSTETNWCRNWFLFQTPCGSASQYIAQTMSLGTEIFGTIMIMIKP